MTAGAGGPASACSSRFVRQLFFCIGLAMVMLLASTTAFAQTTIDPTGCSGEPPSPLKEEFVRPTPPPSPVRPIVLLPPKTGVALQPGTVRVFVQPRPPHTDNHAAFSFITPPPPARLRGVT